MKKLKEFLLILTIVITFSVGSQIVLADEQNIENQGIEEKSKEVSSKEESEDKSQKENPQYKLIVEDEIFTKTYGDYKDQTVYYKIDYIDLTELEDEEGGFFDKFKLLSNVKDGAVGVIYNLLHEVFVAFPFFILKILTASLIFLLNAVYEVNFINSMTNEITTYIQELAGIKGMGFGTTGLFGGFLGIITTVTALYTAYQLIVKKASITAFSGLLKSLTSLVLALVFFSNYGPIIKGLNTLSVETAGLILSGGAEVENGVIDDKTGRERMIEGIWNTFVHQPYLMLQYGTMDEQAIGTARIQKILTAKTDTEDRYKFVKDEITNGNEMMTRGKIYERLGIIIISIIAGTFNSIPILILAFALLFLQFWFTAMAMISPFVFVWSALPNQFRVLSRYMLELITPLVLKFGVALLALIVFSLTSVLSKMAMDTVNNGSVLGYVFLVFTEGILLFTLFLLRKRIMNIFSFGSQELNFLRQEMSNTFVEPAKKGVRTTTTIGGAAVGGILGGAQGAMIGANIGSSIGRTVTGEQDISNTVKQVTLTSMLAKKKDSLGSTNESPTKPQDGTVTVANPSSSKKSQSSSEESTLSNTSDSKTPGAKTPVVETPELADLGEIEKWTNKQSKTPNSSFASIIESWDSTLLSNLDSPVHSQQSSTDENHTILDEVHSYKKDGINEVDKNFELNDVISEIDSSHKDDLSL